MNKRQITKNEKIKNKKTSNTLETRTSFFYQSQIITILTIIIILKTSSKSNKKSYTTGLLRASLDVKQLNKNRKKKTYSTINCIFLFFNNKNKNKREII